MLIFYLKLSFNFIQNIKIQQKQLTLYKSYASAQSGNPEIYYPCGRKIKQIQGFFLTGKPVVGPLSFISAFSQLGNFMH